MNSPITDVSKYSMVNARGSRSLKHSVTCAINRVVNKLCCGDVKLMSSVNYGHVVETCALGCS